MSFGETNLSTPPDVLAEAWGSLSLSEQEAFMAPRPTRVSPRFNTTTDKRPYWALRRDSQDIGYLLWTPGTFRLLVAGRGPLDLPWPGKCPRALPGAVKAWAYAALSRTA